jgi:hypothetical protein
MAVYLPGPPFPFGQIDYPRPGFFFVQGDATAADLRPRAGQALLMVAYPYDVGISVSVQGPPFPFGTVAWPMGNVISVPGSTRQVMAGTEGFTSRPTDSPARTWVAPLVDDPFNFAGELYPGVDPVTATGAGKAGFGEIKMKDAEGRFDRWVDLGWDGRRVEIWRGPRTSSQLADYTRVAVLTAADWKDLSDGDKSLMIRDQQDLLYASSLLGRTYGGTGGIDGDSGVTGGQVPQSYGFVFNVPPVLIDAANLVLQWHDRIVYAVVDLRVGGVSWTNMGDYPTYAALVAASLTNGQFATCNALGLVRLGAQPAFGVRIDGQGDAYGGYTDTRAGIMRRIACTRGPIPLRDSDDLDLSSFSALAIAQPATIGCHVRNQLSVGQALDGIMAGVCGQWWIDFDGKLNVAQFDGPSSLADIVIDLDTAAGPGRPVLVDRIAPRVITRVGYQFNYGPQDPSDIAGAVAADQKLYGDEWRYSQASTDSARTARPSAREVFVPGYFKLKASADAECARQQAIAHEPLRRWRLPARVDPFAKLLGKTIGIKGWNRYGAIAQRNYRCVRAQAGAGAMSTTIDLVGA